MYLLLQNSCWRFRLFTQSLDKLEPG